MGKTPAFSTTLANMHAALHNKRKQIPVVRHGHLRMQVAANNAAGTWDPTRKWYRTF